MDGLYEDKSEHKPLMLPLNKLVSPSIQYDEGEIYQEIYAIQAGCFITLDKDFLRGIIGLDMIVTKQFPIFNGIPDNVYRKLY